MPSSDTSTPSWGNHNFPPYQGPPHCIGYTVRLRRIWHPMDVRDWSNFKQAHSLRLKRAEAWVSIQWEPYRQSRGRSKHG
jgi:hypothetical protein